MGILSSVFGHEDVIPMWIADMDFPPAPVVQALVMGKTSMLWI